MRARAFPRLFYCVGCWSPELQIKRGHQSFGAVNAKGTRVVLAAAGDAGARRFIRMGA